MGLVERIWSMMEPTRVSQHFEIPSVDRVKGDSFAEMPCVFGA